MQDTTVITEEIIEYSADTSAAALQTAEAVQSAQMFETFATLFGAAFIGILVFAIILFIFSAICNWIIYEKAGRKGWESIVPYYNIYVMFKIIGVSLWNLLWVFLPFFGAIVLIVKVIGATARSFGKGTGFAFGLFFLSPIFHAILAFDKSVVYVGPNGVKAEGNAGPGTLDSDI